jgi:biotin carboxylase
MMEDKPFGLLKRGQTFDERGTRPIYVDHDDYFLGLKKSSSFAARDTGNGTRSRSTSISSNSSSNLQEVMHRRYFGREVADPRPLPLMSKNVRMDVDDIQVPESTSQETKSIVIVDTFSTGAVLAYMMYKKGYKIICVLSADLKGLLDMVPEGLEYSFAATFQLNLDIPYEDAILSLIDEITSTGFPVHAVIPGAETGVELADQLSEKMGLTTNGTRLSEARRDKYIMGETIRNAGLRAVRQLKASVWFDIENFISEWNPNPFRVIVKPVDSAGSDDVTLCQSIEDVQKAFGNIMGKINGLGIVNEAVLVQEYLQGKEYVVDAVSKDGVHKICAIWVYDRRPANGAGFVCFGQRMLTMGDDPCLPALVDYQLKVITALGIRNGPTHGEVKWFNDEPVLVEVGSRCHGGDGLWVKIADECMGYNQAQLTCDVYSSQEVFDSSPPLVSRVPSL